MIGCSEGGTSIEDLAEKFPDKIVKIPVDVREGLTDAQVVAACGPSCVHYSAGLYHHPLSSLDECIIDACDFVQQQQDGGRASPFACHETLPIVLSISPAYC